MVELTIILISAICKHDKASVRSGSSRFGEYIYLLCLGMYSSSLPILAYMSPSITFMLFLCAVSYLLIKLSFIPSSFSSVGA